MRVRVATGHMQAGHAVSFGDRRLKTDQVRNDAEVIICTPTESGRDMFGLG
jgi:hypothetical protein